MSATVIHTVVSAGSTNPAKLKPVQTVFGQVYPGAEVQGISVPSGVREQPIGVEETTLGAINRARAALAGVPGAVFGAGLEGGVRFDGHGCWLFGVVAVVNGARLELGRTAELRLPEQVAERLRAGEELGPVMDTLTGERNIKQKAGTVGFLTGGLLTRSDVWRMALTLSLAPFMHPQLYPEP
ncbi:inosine/xanthosine triphosphatase [Deinococcus altitudinis]|uniref:inosine/xanthosine triphosphatase n=1 Tax=Deinococcus altitudinis TaxID=468914 RepID=UPI00389193CE